MEPAKIMAPVRDIIEREVKNSAKRTEPVVKNESSEAGKAIKDIFLRLKKIL